MQFTFLDFAGQTLFSRDDAERAEWTKQELCVDFDFPLVPGKKIETGQRVFFLDPANGSHQIFEIKQPRTMDVEGYQQVHAEHICISELSDEHKDDIEITNKTASQALQTALTDTLWEVGTVDINPTSSGDLPRGSVWQDVLTIQDNWNVYIVPRVVLSSNGNISRYLDIRNPAGRWQGVLLSVDKNLSDPAVIFDDSEVATALFGYGGTIHATTTTGDDEECYFTEIEWTATADHPAKPKGQKWLEDPAATAAFGRNGRKRWGYYQNNDITDPEVLLQKTWEALQQCNSPSLSIDGVVADLYRLGYADQPIDIYDIAICKINGFKKQLQIICYVVDLLNPAQSPVTLGDYIPNIVYIQRQTNAAATGSRGGGGGNKSKQTERKEFETAIESINQGTGLRFRAFQNDLDDLDNQVKLQEASITIEHDRITQEVVDRRNADNTLGTRITSTAEQITLEATRAQRQEGILASSIQVAADNITAEVRRATTAEGQLSSRITVNAQGIETKVSKNGVISAINQTAESVRISANKIQITGETGILGALSTADISCNGLLVNGGFEAYGDSSLEGNLSLTRLTISDPSSTVVIKSKTAEWKETTIPVLGFSSERTWLYGNASLEPTGRASGVILLSHTTKTIHYLGY